MSSVSPTPTIPTFDERRAALMQERPDLFAINSKFAPKLSFADRCALYAYWKAGIERRVLAAAWGINRGTVNFIVTPSSPHYKNVRKEFHELGVDEFGRRYMSDEWDAKIRAATKSYEVQFTDDDVKAMKAAEMGPNPRAKSKAGEHLIRYPDIGNLPGENAKVEILFGEGVDSVTLKPYKGWYIKTAFGPMGRATASGTSAAAFKAFLEDNMAEEVK